MKPILVENRKDLEKFFSERRFRLNQDIEATKEIARCATFAIIGRELHTSQFFDQECNDAHNKHVDCLREQRNNFIFAVIERHDDVSLDDFLSEVEAKEQVLKWLRVGTKTSLLDFLVCENLYFMVFSAI